MTALLTGLAAGLFTAMGLGGGSIFLLASLFTQNASQLQAQGMNLLFFLPVGGISLLFHIKNKMVRFSLALPMITGGVIGAVAGAVAAPLLPEKLLGNLFGSFLLFMGVKALFTKIPAKERGDTP